MNVATSKPNIVLIVGSAPDALRVKALQRNYIQAIVTINNAWQLRDDWDYLIHPDDLPLERLPQNIQSSQSIITFKDYVPAQNYFGGFVYAGGTMSFTAAYWALYTLKPDIMAFIGCDMIYPKDSATHFYGKGSADPLRADVTLQSLEAKSARLQIMALQSQCVCVNLRSLDESRLIFPKIAEENLWHASKLIDESTINSLKHELTKKINETQACKNIHSAQKKEIELNYYINSGRYWQHFDQFNADDLSLIDRCWLSAFSLE